MWLEPKTNWVGTDYIGCDDVNRISGNIKHLQSIASTLFEVTECPVVGNKSAEDYLYADELNSLESALDTVNAESIKQDYGTRQFFQPNDRMISYTELNRLESATLDLYNKLMNIIEGRRTFVIGFGIPCGM